MKRCIDCDDPIERPQLAPSTWELCARCAEADDPGDDDPGECYVCGGTKGECC